MSTGIEQLPISETQQPADQSELASVMQQAFSADTPMYPIGGGTSLTFGLPARQDGIALDLKGLNRIVDYPARDMTITVEAGVTMQAITDALAAEQQQLPIDVPQPEQATIGGVVATNFNGPRRYGLGSIRDFVIGISALDGRGSAFKGGGRVVKNVAGYDFCKLLTGSLGTLGVITQLTLKVRPLPQRSVLLACRLDERQQADKLLEALVHTATAPTAIELLEGPVWADDPALHTLPSAAADSWRYLVVGLEGSDSEVEWMIGQLKREWQPLGVTNTVLVEGDEARQLWRRLAEFPADAAAPLVLKANTVPSGTTRFIAAARELDANCSVQAHAGNGITLVKFSEFPEDGLSRSLIGKLHPAASAVHGNVIVLSNPTGAEMTHQSVWGGIDAPFALMGDVKKQFDPKNLLNPGRFVYS